MYTYRGDVSVTSLGKVYKGGKNAERDKKEGAGNS